MSTDIKDYAIIPLGSLDSFCLSRNGGSLQCLSFSSKPLYALDQFSRLFMLALDDKPNKSLQPLLGRIVKSCHAAVR